MILYFLLCTAWSRPVELFMEPAVNFITPTTHAVFDSYIIYDEYLNKLAQILAFIVSREEWKTGFVLASSNQELTAISSNIQTSVPKFLLFTLSEVVPLNETMERVYTLLGEDKLNFIVLCSTKCIVKLLYEAKKMETKCKKASRWSIMPTDGFITDVMQSQIPVLHSDVVVLEVLTGSRSQQLLNESLVCANVLSLQSSLTGYIVQHRGHIWEDGNMSISDELFPGVKYGFNGKKLIVSTLEWPPFVQKQAQNGSFSYTGVCIDLLKELAASLNFTYEIVEPVDQEWGRVLNGTWTGLIGQLAYKTVDLVVAPITVTDVREEVLDFTVPFYYVHSAIILKKPDPDRKKWMTLIAPFHIKVHICILSALILSSALLLVVEKLTPLSTLTTARRSARWKRYVYILWFHFEVLVKRGGIFLPTTLSGRNVVICWAMFAVMSAAIYSGNLIAFLTDWREKPPFSNLAGMVEQDTYIWGIVGGSAYVTLFQDSNLPVYRKIWQGLQRDPDMVTTNMSIHKKNTLAGRYAYLGEITLTEIWKRENCDLQILHDNFFLMTYSVALQNDSIHTRLFSKQVLRIYEMGLLQLWYKRNSKTATCEISRSVKRIDLPALQSAFYMVAVGVTLALFVMMIEVFCHWKQRTHQIQLVSKT